MTDTHTDTDTDQARLIERLQRLEDESEIRRLIASYGPFVDHGDAEATAGLWADDGRYDVDGHSYADPAAIATMVHSEAHQGLIANGCAHFLGPLQVSIDGDEATAVCYSLLLERSGAQHVVRRASANRWELRRTGQGWRTTLRTNRYLGGDPAAHGLLVGE